MTERAVIPADSECGASSRCTGLRRLLFLSLMAERGTAASARGPRSGDVVRDIERTTGLVVLIVDDHEDTRALCGEYFERHQMIVHHAVDGEHALLKVLGVDPDVIVMDLAMPGVDGWEATRRIRAHARTKDTPILVSTAYSDPDSIRCALEAGATRVLLKPCTPSELLHAVLAIIDVEYAEDDSVRTA